MENVYVFFSNAAYFIWQNLSIVTYLKTQILINYNVLDGNFSLPCSLIVQYAIYSRILKKCIFNKRERKEIIYTNEIWRTMLKNLSQNKKNMDIGV